MLDYLIEDNDLENAFKEYGLRVPQDIIFIKEMINGPQNADEHCEEPVGNVS